MGNLHKSRVRVSPVNDRRSKHHLQSAAILTSQFRQVSVPIHLLPEPSTSGATCFPLLLGQPLKLCFLLRYQPHVEGVGLVRVSSHAGWDETRTPCVHTQTRREEQHPADLTTPAIRRSRPTMLSCPVLVSGSMISRSIVSRSMVSRQQPVIDMTSGTLKFDVGRSGGCHWPHLDQSLTAFHSALQPVLCRLIRSLNDRSHCFAVRLS